MCLKRPVYRGFKCEGSFFYPHTYPHIYSHTLTLTLTPSLFRQESILLVGDSMDGRGWSSGLADSYVTRLAMVYMEIRYGIQGEYLCCTFGARALHFWCQGAALFLALLFVSLYSGFSVGQTFWFSFDFDCTLTGQMGFKTDFAWKKREYIFFRTRIGLIGRIF